jgi:hypothetical protein
MRLNGWACLAFWALATVFAISQNALAERPEDPIRRPAVFKVTNDVVTEEVRPFTATINGFGNSLVSEGGGFEPIVFRNKIIASEDAPNRIVSSIASLTRYDTLREGFLDDASVRVYRIEGGRFRLVREDKVAAGGAHASGWIPLVDNPIIVTPDTTRFNFRWDEWNRPGVPYYFTVRGIDRYGNLSPAAAAFSIRRPEHPGKGQPVNTLTTFHAGVALLSTGRSLPAPQRLRGTVAADGLLTLEWDPIQSPDLGGYIVYRSDVAPQLHSGYYLQLAGSAAAPEQNIKAGDMIIVSKKLYTASRTRDLSNRVWGAANEYSQFMPRLLNFFPDETPATKSWELVPHDNDTPVSEPGETYLKLRLAPGTTESVSLYNHSGTGQSWYEVLEKVTYRAEVWLRQEGSGSVRFKFSGFYDSPPQAIPPTVFDVGQGWKKYVTYFTPSVIQEGARPNEMLLEFTGPGTFSVDNFRVYRADIPYLDLLPRDYDALKSSGMSALRTHGSIKTSIRTYDMDQFTNAGGVISGTVKSNTLPQMLKTMRKAGVSPWLQIEFHMSPKEWLGFVEYLAAPYDPLTDTPSKKPWAYKRYRQGQAKPWVDEFDKMYIELSNETWNGLFAPWAFDPMTDSATGKEYSRGQVYGLYQEFVLASMRGSPYWKPADLDKKLSFVLGGWEANLAYGRDAAAASPSSEFLTIGAYNGGWDAAEGPPPLNAASLFDTLAHTNQSAIPVADGYARELLELNAKRTKKLRMGTYEAGPGYALNGLNNAHVTDAEALAQEQVMKSLAAGTATLDSFLVRAYRGFAIQNFFTFDSGPLWKSHARWYHGGQAYPSWKLLSLFNQQATGKMLRTETVSVPSADLQGFSRRLSINGAPLIAVYATQKADRVSVLVLSRKVSGYPKADDDGFNPVTVALPFGGAKSVTLYRMTAPAHVNNLLADSVKIEKIDIPPTIVDKQLRLNAETGADARGLPPASTYLYVFDGVTVH